jgi:hypothetical protein
MENYQESPYYIHGSPDYRSVVDTFFDGKIKTKTPEELQDYLIALSNHATGDDAIQSRDIIQGITINHILLQHHIDDLNKKNSVIQFLVIALTIASLFGTVFQTWYSYKADQRAELRVESPKESQKSIPEQTSQENLNPKTETKPASKPLEPSTKPKSTKIIPTEPTRKSSPAK